MGDRCYVKLECRKADLPIVYSVFGIDEHYIQSEEDGIVTIGLEEMNYGAEDELQSLTEQGVPFVGWHGEGGSYDAHHFCGVAGAYSSIPVTREGHYFLIADENGKILNKDDKKKIRAYATFEAKTQKTMMSG